MGINVKNIVIGLRNSVKCANYLSAYFSYKRRLSWILGCSIEQINRFYKEINDSDFIRDIITRSEVEVGLSHLTMISPLRAPAIYVVCRIIKPEIVVETGVANGFSSSFILRALEVNRKGRLYSIDLPNQPGEELEGNLATGWLVSDDLRKRWVLTLGASKEKLPWLFNDLRRIDIFYHDSDHSYKNMMFEFNIAWKYLNFGGLLLGDDITDNHSFKEFVKNNRCNYIELFKLGIAVKK